MSYMAGSSTSPKAEGDGQSDCAQAAAAREEPHVDGHWSSEGSEQAAAARKVCVQVAAAGQKPHTDGRLGITGHWRDEQDVFVLRAN